MKATELYSVGYAAYNGNDDARKTYFMALAPIAKRFGKVYGVLPSLILAKSAIESGYASDLYEDSLEADYGIMMGGKAQNHNNIFAVNAFEDNKKYLDKFPKPAWNDYRAEFIDYGTHYTESGREVVRVEPWKHYNSVDDCVEDWCANIRYQAEKHGKAWGSDLLTQITAIESYTPEGGEAERKGLHFDWQDQVAALSEKFRLFEYDKEVTRVERKALTVADLDKAIKDAYEYAHKFCHYAPTDNSFPPMEDGKADCVGLALRAFYTLGYNHSKHNINEIGELCEVAGLTRSNDLADVASRHGIVCMCPKGDTHNIAHVYYSLGGESYRNISKYDLGSEERIESDQPFTNAPANEWADRRSFLCIWFVDSMPKFTGKPLFEAVTKKAVTLREIAGKGNKAVCSVPKGETVKVYAAVNTGRINRWFYVSFGKQYGFCYSGALSYSKYKIPKDKKKVADTPDNSLACRVGAGEAYPIFKLCPSLSNGTQVRVINRLESADGSLWYNVYRGGLCYFVSGVWLV